MNIENVLRSTEAYIQNNQKRVREELAQREDDILFWKKLSQCYEWIIKQGDSEKQMLAAVNQFLEDFRLYRVDNRDVSVIVESCEELAADPELVKKLEKFTDETVVDYIEVEVWKQ